MHTKQEYTTTEQPERALGDAPQERACLRCKVLFPSEGFGQRICARCKGSSVWRAAIPEGVSYGKRRSGGRSS